MTMCGYKKNRLIVLSAFISIVVVVRGPHAASAASDRTRRRPVDGSQRTGNGGGGSTDRPPPPPLPAPEQLESDVVVTSSSGCVDYDTDPNDVSADRYYIRELVEDVEGDHVIVDTYYGQLRGVRIAGIPAAGENSGLSQWRN